MFKSPEHAVYFCESIIFYNRYIGEMLVCFMNSLHTIPAVLRSIGL